MTDQMFFDGWDTITRTIVVGVLAYLSLILMLRVSGKRTLSKMNAFDFIVTVALGSTLAAALIDKNVPLIQASVALGLLIFLQFVLTWMSVRWPWFQRTIKAEPSLIVSNGEINESTARRERITREEILAALRNQGYGKIEEIDAVVMETDGTISVLKNVEHLDVSSIDPVARKRAG